MLDGVAPALTRGAVIQRTAPAATNAPPATKAIVETVPADDAAFQASAPSVVGQRKS